MNIKTRPFTLFEIQSLVSHSPEPWRAIYMIAYQTGLRVSDLLRLPFRLPASPFYLSEKKTGNTRKIQISPSIASSWISIQSFGVQRDFLFPFRDVSAYRKALVRHCAYCGIDLDRVAFHSIRKSTATHISENIGILAAMDFLGHKKLSTTMLYIEQDSVECANLLEANTHLFSRVNTGGYNETGK